MTDFRQYIRHSNSGRFLENRDALEKWSSFSLRSIFAFFHVRWLWDSCLSSSIHLPKQHKSMKKAGQGKIIPRESLVFLISTQKQLSIPEALLLCDEMYSTFLSVQPGPGFDG
jgi:hypothetical protein